MSDNIVSYIKMGLIKSTTYHECPSCLNRIATFEQIIRIPMKYESLEAYNYILSRNKRNWVVTHQGYIYATNNCQKSWVIILRACLRCFHRVDPQLKLYYNENGFDCHKGICICE